MAHTKLQELHWRIQVETGGGIFRGVQHGFAHIQPLILFDGPSKSTMALTPSELSADRVRSEIAKKEAEYARAGIARTAEFQQVGTEVA